MRPDAAAPCRVPALLMDNHKEALAFWRSLGITGATCIHVDAHLDVSNKRAHGRGDSEDAGVDCGNFLYPAIRDGLVTHLVWVVPPHLAASSPALLDWVRHELPSWVRLTTTDSRSLRTRDGRVEGTLLGARLTVCTAEHLPRLDSMQPTLVDVDIDYFLGPRDDLWQGPIELCDRLAHVGAAAITVAQSVDGGHTPPQHRYLGQLGLMCLTGGRDEALALWNRLQDLLDPGAVQGGESEGGPAPSTPGEGPAWFEAARLALQACRDGHGYVGPAWDAVVARDPAYRVRPLDMASFCFRREDFDGCLAWLERVEEVNDRPGVVYQQGLVACRRGRFDVADAKWTELLGQPVAQGGTAAHLHEMRGRTHAERGRDAEALASFEAALRLVPHDATVWRQVAETQQKMGLVEAAARSARRAVSLAPQDVATLAVRRELALGYAERGEILLAQAAWREILRQDDGALATEARAALERLGDPAGPAGDPAGPAVDPAARLADPAGPAGDPAARLADPAGPAAETDLPADTRALIRLCDDVREGAAERIPDLEAQVRAGREELEGARARFHGIGERDRGALPPGSEALVEAVERAFEGCARAFDWIDAFLAERDGVHLWHAASGLARSTRLLFTAQSAYEACVLTAGPSRFPTMNLFHNLAVRLRGGQVSPERWKAACEGHRPLFAALCSDLPRDEAGIRAARILEVLAEMAGLTAESGAGEFTAALQSLMDCHVALEGAVGAHQARLQAAPPTGSPAASCILMAAREGRLTPELLEGGARVLQEQVRDALGAVRAATREAARSVAELAEVPRMLDALEAVDDALDVLRAHRDRAGEIEYALWQLQEGLRHVDSAQRALRHIEGAERAGLDRLAIAVLGPSSAPPA